MKISKYKRMIALVMAVALTLTTFMQSSMIAEASPVNENITEEQGIKSNVDAEKSEGSGSEDAELGSGGHKDSVETEDILKEDSGSDDGQYKESADDNAEDKGTVTTESADIPIEELQLYDEKERTDLLESEIAVAHDINVLIDSDYNVADVHDGIDFYEDYVEVLYVSEKSDFNISKVGNYETFYKVTPYSGKTPYLVKRTVNVSEPDYTSISGNSNKKSAEKDKDSEDEDPASENDASDSNILAGDKRSNDDFPLSKGEIESIQSNYASFVIKLDDNQDTELIEEGIDPETGVQDEELREDSSIELNTKPVNNSPFAIAGDKMFSALSVLLPAVKALAADVDKDTMKVSYSGYASYCGHRTGVKYVSEDGNYKNHLVYCLDMNRNTTSGTVTAGGKVKAQITFCLVNGARTLGGKCHTDTYSTGNATADYFVTSGAIHVLNGEVSLSYYNDGSNVYKKIEQMVKDAKNLDKSKYNLETGLTKSITYTITPKQAGWKEVSDGLYKSDEKFVRDKSGTITDVKYKITGAPSSLKTGEINKDAKDIVDEDDLKKYDICVAQTDKDKASSNFYLYCNEEAMKAILKDKLVIKIQAKAYADEKGGRKWTPTVISQQKITFLEDFNSLSAKATVKLASDFKTGALAVKKTDTFSGVPIPGASYYLYEDADCDDLLCELTDNGDGLYTSAVETLTQDTYYLKEVNNPDGYQLDETVYTITEDYFTLYDSDGKVTREGKEFTHQEIPEKSGVIVTKKDAFTQKEITTAGFAVFNNPECTVRTVIDAEKEPTEVPIFTYDEDLGGAVSEKFVKTQELYYVKEVVIPPGYKDSGTVWTVSPGYGDVAQVAVENTPVRCNLTASKKDAETGETKPQGDASLAGALYGLYAAEDIAYPDGSGVVTYTDTDPITSDKGTDFQFFQVPAAKDTLLATVRTDADALFSFANMYMGNYYVKEIEPSKGYKLNDTTYSVSFASQADSHADIGLTLEVDETPVKQPFEIIKVSTDGDTGEVDKVKGAEFTVKLQSEVDKIGWDKAKTYDVLTTDDSGYAKSKELIYGTYLVKETKVPKDLYKTNDFTVTIDSDSREPQVWRTLNDAPFKAYIRFIKKDKETGEIVRLPGVTFKIKKSGTDDYVSLKVGDKQVSEFVTDETGTVTTPLKLKYGNYEVTEIKAPEGYLLSEDVVPFVVTKEGAIQIEEDEDGDPAITIDMENESVKGAVKIHKEGEVLTGAVYDTIVDRILTAITGDNRSVTFTYEKQPLEGAVYHLIADEDIIRADHQTDENGELKIAIFNDIPLKKDTVVAELVTDEDGEADIEGLPLGKYRIEEIKAPDGFVIDEEAKHFELAYADDHTEVVYQKEEYVDKRVKTELSLLKKDANLATPVTGAAYGIYATVDIVGRSGDVLVAADSLIERVETDENGSAKFGADLPLGRYYVKEIETAPGYVTDPGEYEVDFTYQDPKVELLTKAIDINEIPIVVQVSKSDITNGIEIIGAELEIIDSNNEVYASWTTTGEAFTLNAIPAGKYRLREKTAPYGYMIANEVEFEVQETGEIQKVTMVDERVKGYIEIYKTDSKTKKAIKGVKFEIQDADGKVIQKLKTDKKGYAKSDELDICTYKENGEKDQDIVYYVVETKAAKGYILDEKKHEVVIAYVGNASGAIPYQLKLTNKPEVPKLPQTGGNYQPWIFTMLGAMFILVAMVMYFKRRKAAVGAYGTSEGDPDGENDINGD